MDGLSTYGSLVTGHPLRGCPAVSNGEPALTDRRWPMAQTPMSEMPAPLTLRLFGPLEAAVHGVPLPRLRSRTGYRLLALLVLRHGREVEREWLAGTLWPESAAADLLVKTLISLGTS